MSNMKLLKLWSNWFSMGALVLAGFLFVGCQTNTADQSPDTRGTLKEESDKLQVGNTIRLEFSNLSSSNPLQPFEEQIKDNGNITPPLIGSVKAAGKTTGELQHELQTAYNKYYVAMTVTVKAPDRFYSVGGEVKMPNRQIYMGGTTVIKAIQSAGDLTEFANHRKIQLTRANGKTYTINYDKALKDPKLDLPVYPGDSIHVPQRFF